MENGSQIRRIAFLGNYPPRQCGIATFTADLFSAVKSEFPTTRCFAIPINDVEARYEYPPEVRFEIEEQDISSYRRAADFLNLSNIDVVSVQHEFGIFGGRAGGHLLTFLRELKMPVVTTLHTILQQPDADQRRAMDELTRLSSRLVTMTEHGKKLIQAVYNTTAEKIDVIPHGIPDMPFVDPNYYKDNFGVEGRFVLLTFGLLSPNKGIEQVLNAMPEILAEFPNVVYIILGATHPTLLREQGEAYRLSLERLAHKKRIEKSVIFYNQFVELEQLKEFIGAADIYITPYLNPAQSSSGTLAYSFGAGKAVVSTPYWHATELLANDCGVLVPFGDANAVARTVTGLLRDETRRHAIRKNAYKASREMTWSNVAKLYMQSFVRGRVQRGEIGKGRFAIKTLDQQPYELPELKLDHLLRMTDSTGIFQHAIYTVPNFAEGYSIDDNARALILTVLLEELGEEPSRVRTLATTYAAFLNHALNRDTKRFRNFLGFDRCWLEECGSEDSHGRAIWALGLCVGRSQRRSFQMLAADLFNRALPPVPDFISPRAWAFTLLGIHEYLKRLSGDRRVTQMREQLVARLIGLFEKCGDDNWCWCEESVTYDNAKLPHALIVSGAAMNDQAVLDCGLKALRWLAEIQMPEKGIFRPVGCNGFYQRGKTRATHDQQPVEAHSTLSAYLDTCRITGDLFWYEEACRAFDWFLGGNDLGLEVYSSNTGGCYDALHVDRLNENQGAESTLAFLLSLAEMKLAQTSAPPINGSRVAAMAVDETDIVTSPVEHNSSEATPLDQTLAIRE